jgi:hypothetical protein
MVSKTFRQVIPRLVVFHKPPEALATKMTEGFEGRASTSWTRPPVTAGPMTRGWRAWRWALEMGAVSCPAAGATERRRTQRAVPIMVLAEHRGDMLMNS